MTTVHVYVITNIINGKEYVGKTIKTIPKRWAVHVCAARSKDTALARAIRKHGIENFVIESVWKAPTEAEALATEIALIEALGTNSGFGYNMTAGGEGWSGMKASASHRASIAAALRGKPLAPERIARITEVRRTPESRAKSSAIMHGKQPPATAITNSIAARKGKPLSISHKAKIAVSLKGDGRIMSARVKAALAKARVERVYSPLSPAHKAKLRAARLGIDNVSVEGRARVAAAHRGKIVSVETREKQAAARRGKTLSPEARAKISTAQKGKPKSPETRERMRAAQQSRTVHPWTGRQHSEETRKKMSMAQSGIAKSPEHRAAMSAAQKGKTVPPEILAKRSASLTGQKRTAETRANISASKKGHTVSNEARRKIGEANRGRSHTDEARAKMSAARLGTTRSEETRAKMREAWQRRRQK